MRLLLTNDDGIDSIGLHVLARRMREFGEVIIVAPDQEYSGAGAAIGAIWDMRPEVSEGHVDGIDEAWAVSGAPALCVMFARMGAFGPAPDLIVSGINPGANVGRSVYHSGTIGAAISGRNGGISGVAVSQAVHNFGVEGQAWEETIKDLHWETAAEVAASAVQAMIDTPPPAGSILNVNVPDLPVDELTEWRWTEVGVAPPNAMVGATLEQKLGHKGRYHVNMSYGGSADQPEGTDTRAIKDHAVSLTWLSRIVADEPHTPSVDAAMNSLIG